MVSVPLPDMNLTLVLPEADGALLEHTDVSDHVQNFLQMKLNAEFFDSIYEFQSVRLFTNLTDPFLYPHDRRERYLQTNNVVLVEVIATMSGSVQFSRNPVPTSNFLSDRLVLWFGLGGNENRSDFAESLESVSSSPLSQVQQFEIIFLGGNVTGIDDNKTGGGSLAEGSPPLNAKRESDGLERKGAIAVIVLSITALAAALLVGGLTVRSRIFQKRQRAEFVRRTKEAAGDFDSPQHGGHGGRVVDKAESETNMSFAGLSLEESCGQSTSSYAVDETWGGPILQLDVTPPREEATSLPPYDPRRLERIISMSNKVVQKETQHHR